MRPVIISFFFSFSLDYLFTRLVSSSLFLDRSTRRSVLVHPLFPKERNERGKKERKKKVRDRADVKISRQRGKEETANLLFFGRLTTERLGFLFFRNDDDGSTDRKTPNGWPDSTDRTRYSDHTSNRWRKKKSDTGPAAEGANPYAHCQQ